MKISYIVPNYKNPALLEACLKSLRQFHSNQEIIVIDDGSPDNTPKLIEPICERYNAKLLRSFWNNGFSHAVNRGISGCSGDIVVLVNSDVTFTCNIEDAIINKFKEDDRIGIIGCLLLYPNLRVQHGGFLRLQNLDIIHEDYQKTLRESNLH